MSGVNVENSIGRKLQEDFCLFCASAASIFEKFSFLKEPALALWALERSVVHPFNIAVFGRMKTGKSTLINALIGENLAITGVEEATATINVISHSLSSDQLGHFTVHWKDEPPQTYPLENHAKEWSGKTQKVLENIRRTSFIELYSSLNFLKLCEITDTPGTGSEVTEHEKITQDFLDATVKQGRRADAIIYVFPPVGRESDLENLDTFRQNNCIPGSDPYNSVAVLHKWDHIFWENGGDIDDIKQKAKRIYTAMSSFIADVIPVSAPLALASVKAPDSFIDEIRSLCNEHSWDELESFLSRDTKWTRDERRKKILDSYSLPWATFQIIVREISKNPDCAHSTNEVRTHLRVLSGIDTLLLFLDRNFFKHGEVIRQKQKYAEIYRIKKTAYNLIQEKLGSLDYDIASWNALYNMEIQDQSLTKWLSRKRLEALKEKEEILKAFESLDAKFLNSSIPQLIQDEETLRWCENAIQQKNLLSSEHYLQIKGLFDYLAGDQSAMPPAILSGLGELHIHIAQLCSYPSKRVRDNASHIRGRIEEFLDIQNEGQNINAEKPS